MKFAKDWDTKNLLLFVVGIQVGLLVAMAMDAMGLGIPLFRQFLGFVFLTIIPGILILRLLDLRQIGALEALIYIAGLSLAFLVLLGILMNMLYPLFGVSKPIETLSIMITLTIAMTILCMLVSIRKKNDRVIERHLIKRSSLASMHCVFLISLPLLAVLGTVLVNFYGSNILLMILLVAISVVPILVVFNRLRKNYYPLAVVSIALSLLFHNSLISMNLVEWADISWEYYFSKTVLINQIWAPQVPNNFNSIPGIVILAPFFAQVCNLSLTWVFKIIFPLLFSLVPLGIYRVVQKQTTDKVAFLSSFFFMSMFAFFTVSLGLVRFQIAALFLVLLLLVVVKNKRAGVKDVSMFILFSCSLILSHYASSFVFLIILVGALGARFLIDSRTFHASKISAVSVLAYLAMVLAWYSYVSSGSVLNMLTWDAKQILAAFTGFWRPESTGLRVILKEPLTQVSQIQKVVHIVTEFFIVIGVLISLLKRKYEGKFKSDYLAFSSVSFLLVAAGLLVPYLSSTIGTARLYHLNLLFLAPFCVIGGIAVISKISDVVKRSHKAKPLRNNSGVTLKILGAFFVVYLLLNSGVINEIAGQPISFSLNSARVWLPHFSEEDVEAAEWLNNRTNVQGRILADLTYAHLFMMLRGDFRPLEGGGEVATNVSDGDYVFLGSQNLIDGKMTLSDPASPRLSYKVVTLQDLDFHKTLFRSDKVYDSYDAQAFWFP